MHDSTMHDSTMHKDPRIWLACGAFAAAAWLIVPQLSAARTPAVRAEDVPDIDYVCRETREVFRLPAAEGPQVNPRTGKATLVPAQFDARTKSWRPGPPPDVRQRMRGAR
jgi:hypothetical protein